MGITTMAMPQRDETIEEINPARVGPHWWSRVWWSSGLALNHYSKSWLRLCCRHHRTL